MIRKRHRVKWHLANRSQRLFGGLYNKQWLFLNDVSNEDGCERVPLKYLGRGIPFVAVSAVHGGGKARLSSFEYMKGCLSGGQASPT